MRETAIKVVPADFAPPVLLDRFKSRSLFVGAPVLLLAAVLAFVNWEVFLRSWLFAFMFWLGISLGSLTLLMLQYTSGGNWGRIGRRIWEAAAQNIPLMFVFFLPLWIAMFTGHLFPWRHMDASELGEKGKYYLTPFWFSFRAIVYFLGWGGLAWRLRRWSFTEEAGLNTPAQFVSIQNLCGAGILFYALTITFASIDWTMSLNPKWWSTVWGMLFMVGQVLTTFAFTIWLLTRLVPIEPLSKMFKVDYYHDFGKLMFAFVVLWAYLSFSQWLIMWSGNLSAEIKWYLDRLQSWWRYIGTVLILFHFLVPFFIMLSRSLKRNARKLAAMALWLLFMRFVDLFWLIVPNFHEAGQVARLGAIDWLCYIVSPIAMGGIWLYFFFGHLSRRSLMPVNDPHFVEMLEAKHG